MRISIAFLLSILLCAWSAGPARAVEAPRLELPDGLHAELVSPGQLRIGWDDGVAARLFVDFAPRREDGRFDPPVALESRNLDEMRAAPAEELPTRPQAGDALEEGVIAARLPGDLGEVQTEMVHWGWVHVDGLLLCSFRVLSPRGGELRLHWDTLRGGHRETWNGELPLHEDAGERGARTVRLERARWERADGGRLYLGLIDLDSRARARGGRLEVEVAPEDEARVWTLALVVASSEASFRYRSGQALRMKHSESEPSKISDMTQGRLVMPPICYLCRSAGAEAVGLRIRSLGSEEIELDLRVRGLEGHGRLDGEAVVLGGFPMARWWTGNEGADRAQYRLPRENPAAGLLIEAAAATGHVEGEIRLDTGVALPLPTAELDPALRRERQEELAEKLLPQHLSPELLEAWPNPFQDRTSIRVRIPETVGEAFQFPEGAPQGVDLLAAPPFGESPSIRIKVYNVSGKLVRVLEERPEARGILQVDWDGTNLSGHPVAAGAYYVSVEMGEYKVTHRVLRLRS